MVAEIGAQKSRFSESEMGGRQRNVCKNTCMRDEQDTRRLAEKKIGLYPAVGGLGLAT